MIFAAVRGTQLMIVTESRMVGSEEFVDSVATHDTHKRIVGYARAKLWHQQNAPGGRSYKSNAEQINAVESSQATTEISVEKPSTSRPLPRVEIGIARCDVLLQGGIAALAVVDSGASKSIISPAVLGNVRGAGESVRTSLANVVLKMANGELTQCTEEVQISFQFVMHGAVSHTERTHVFCVVDSIDHDLIL